MLLKNISMEDYFLIAFLFLVAVLWTWALIDLFKRVENLPVKGLWFIAILFFPLIGPVVYFQIGRKRAVGGRRKLRPDFH